MYRIIHFVSQFVSYRLIHPYFSHWFRNPGEVVGYKQIKTDDNNKKKEELFEKKESDTKNCSIFKQMF